MASKKKLKISAILVSLVVGFIVFLGSIFLTNKLTGESRKKAVVKAKVTIPSGTSITEENIAQYFCINKVDPEDIVDNAVLNSGEILDKMVRSDIIKGSGVSKDQFADSKMDLNLLKDPVEVSLNFANMGSVVSGTLRSGDIVNVIAINTSNGQVAGTLNNVYVNKVLNTDGIMLGREDPGAGLNVNLIINKADEDFISSHLLTCEFRIVKVK